jgi:hypothetical protein
MPGVGTSEVEVSLASNKGFWLLLKNEELFVPYAEFPWVKQVTLEQITPVEWPTPNHINWPLLDVDLTVESIRNPGQFPLVAKPTPHSSGTRQSAPLNSDVSNQPVKGVNSASNKFPKETME